MNEQLNQLPLFIAIVECGNFSQAAQKLGVSVSTISRQLTALENRLGLKLVIRSTRKIVLTEHGQAYYTALKDVFQHLQYAENQLTQARDEPAGRLHISAPTLFGRHYLVPLLTDFMQCYPKINLEVTLLDREVDLVEEGIDLAIRVGDLADSALIQRRLGQIQWITTASPEYLSKHSSPQSPTELMQHACLIYTSATNFEWPFLHQGKIIKLKVPAKMQSNTLDAVVSAAMKGMGIVLTPAWFVRNSLQQGVLTEVLHDYRMPPRPIYALFTHQHFMAQKVRLLLDYLAEHLDTEELT